VIFAGNQFSFELKYIITGLIIVFFVGIKDDILVIDPFKKLAGQIFAAILIAVFADIRITSLFGLFHITDLPYFASILLTVFVFIVVTNGFNLIDGIDGLASGVGILTSSVFGIWFWTTGNVAYSVFSFSFVGALAAFFGFNVFGKTNKIFLGDTGSIVTGFAVGIMACRFLQLELVSSEAFAVESAPAVTFGVLVIPLFDSLRVFFLRIWQGSSPFRADRQHIHHRILQMGYSHLHATIILVTVNIFFIAFSYSLRNIGVFWLTFLIVGMAVLMSSLLAANAIKREKQDINIYGWYHGKKSTKHKIKLTGIPLKEQERIFEQEKCSTIS